jgi:hypothetical protein
MKKSSGKDKNKVEKILRCDQFFVVWRGAWLLAKILLAFS